MGINISRNFEFLAGVYYEGEFMMNQYSVMLTMDVNTGSIREQNIAMDRMKYFIYEVLNSVVFVQATETKMIEKFQAAGMKVCTLPEEPYDQIITILLYYKLNAITENKLSVNNIQLDSVLSDGVGFMWGAEESLVGTPYSSGWWTENSVSINDKNTIGKKDKIVKLVKKSDWSSLGLDWKDKDFSHTEIIFKPEA